MLRGHFLKDFYVSSTFPFKHPHLLSSCYFFQVSHVLNVAYGVTNLFPDHILYKTLQILDLPETDITSHLEQCSSFIDQAREQVHFTYTLYLSLLSYPLMPISFHQIDHCGHRSIKKVTKRFLISSSANYLMKYFILRMFCLHFCFVL